ncbi:MAG: hypothetical protein II563_11275 [Treponema sp.]|nr:hypothetical protein [Treponema sp.]MBQ4235396.1 hypothetical protein [Treponema sp.]MBQ5383589.1 hypothetical protein [Treponema sp.]
MVKKLLALAAVLVLGCASVFASGDVDVQLIDEMDFDEFYETFSNADEASDYFDLDLEECYDYSVIDEFFETMTANVSGLDDGTVILVSDDDYLYVYLWGSGLYYAFSIE